MDSIKVLEIIKPLLLLELKENKLNGKTYYSLTQKCREHSDHNITIKLTDNEYKKMKEWMDEQNGR